MPGSLSSVATSATASGQQHASPDRLTAVGRQTIVSPGAGSNTSEPPRLLAASSARSCAGLPARAGNVP